MSATSERPLLVVGAGISGITCAVEAAEARQRVLLVEREPFVGGRVLRSHLYFPKLCPPSCGMELNVRRLERSPRVEVVTGAIVKQAAPGEAGWSITLERAPEHVSARCTLCGECSKVCPATVPDPFELGFARVPAIRLPHPGAWPRRFTIDRSACPDGCTRCVQACRYEAIDLGATATEETREVGAVVIATGWRPYPIEKLPELGGGVLEDVVANVRLERLAAASGPTTGRITRPSDGRAPRRVAFVQCAGSRDVRHLPYCSGVCCLASLKQALYVREKLPDAEVTIFSIDRRTPGRNEELLTRVAADERVRMIQGKVGKIEKGKEGAIELRVEDVEQSRLETHQADLVVLATGMVPCAGDEELPFPLAPDADGFLSDDSRALVFVAGVAQRPQDVAASARAGTAAAARALVAMTARRSAVSMGSAEPVAGDAESAAGFEPGRGR